MFLSKFLKHTRAKAMIALAGLTMVFGVGAAVSTLTATQQNEAVETKAADPYQTVIYCASNVTPKWQINCQGDADNWRDGTMSLVNGKTWNGLNVYTAKISHPYNGAGSLKFFHDSWQNLTTVWGDDGRTWKETSYFSNKLFIYQVKDSTGYVNGPKDYVTDSSRSFYFAVPKATVGSYSTRINVQRSYNTTWLTQSMALQSGITYNGKLIYSISTTAISYVDQFQFQIVNSGSVIDTKVPTSSSMTNVTDIAGKMYEYDVGWVTYEIDSETTATANIYWVWSGSWNIDPYLKYCGNDGVWSGFIHMSGNQNTKTGEAYYSIPAGTTAVKFFHGNDGDDGYGRTAMIGLRSGDRGTTYNVITTEGISSEAFPAATQSYKNDGGLTSGHGLYVTACSEWIANISGSTGLYAYFFSADSTNAWSARLTPVPGEDDLFETEVPEDGGSSQTWCGIIITLHTKSEEWPTKANQTVDLLYTASNSSYSHITVSNSYSGEKRQATFSSDFGDSERALLWGANFNESITCDNKGHNDADSDKWDDAKDDYDNAATSVRSLIKEATASSTGDELAKAVSKYDDIIYKYGTDAGIISKTYSDFLSRQGETYYSGGAGYAGIVPGMPTGAESPLTTTLWIVLASGAAGLSAIGAAYFISKKKKRNRA